jgi:hypothetical protein
LQSVGIYKSAASAGIDSPKYDNHGALKTAAKLGLMSNDILNFTSGLSPVNLNQF